MNECVHCKKSDKYIKSCPKQKCIYHKIISQNNIWLCLDCYNVFPFHCLENSEFNQLFNVQTDDRNAVKFTSKVLNTIEYDFARDDLCLNDQIDPDVNFYKNVANQKSLCYSNDEFCQI